MKCKNCNEDIMWDSDACKYEHIAKTPFPSSCSNPEPKNKKAIEECQHTERIGYQYGAGLVHCISCGKEWKNIIGFSKSQILKGRESCMCKKHFGNDSSSDYVNCPNCMNEISAEARELGRKEG